MEKDKQKEQPEGLGNQQPRPKPLTRIIHIIDGGPSAGGSSQFGKKMYAGLVNLVTTNSFGPKCVDPITFTKTNMDGVNFPHSDTIIIKAN